MLYYQPLEKTELFHKSPVPTRALFGGNRSGKTTAGGTEFLFHATGIYPKWYPEAQRYKGPIRGRIIAKDFQKGVGEVIIPLLEEWLDSSLVAKKFRNPIGIPVKWTLKNGSVFDILTHEQNTEQFEGWKGHIAWFDEPPPRDKYIATLRGLVDFRGRNWLTLTPLTQPWIYDEIYTKSDAKRIFAVTMDIRENKHLDPKAIAEFEKNLTEEEKEARLHGRFMHLSGLIYKEFDSNIHLIEPFQIKENWTRYFCLDTHPRIPTACVWLAVDPHDNHYIYDELWIGDMTVEQICHAIHVQEGELKPTFRFIDPALDADNELMGGFNIRKEFMKYGIYCTNANNDPDLGRSRIKAALKPRYMPQIRTEMPQLRIFRTCRRVVYEFQHYTYAERHNHQDYYDLKESPRKKDDHTMDCIRYIYNAGPRYISPESQDEPEVEYEGTYTKYPTNRLIDDSKYHELTE